MVTAPEQDTDVLLRSGVGQKLLPGNLGPQGNLLGWGAGSTLPHLVSSRLVSSHLVISFEREKRLVWDSPPPSALSTDRTAPREAERGHVLFSSGLPENQVLANDFHSKMWLEVFQTGFITCIATRETGPSHLNKKGPSPWLRVGALWVRAKRSRDGHENVCDNRSFSDSAWPLFPYLPFCWSMIWGLWDRTQAWLS